MPIATINPATGETLKTFDPMPPEQIESRLAAAVRGFTELRGTSFAERAGWMQAAADILDAECDGIAATMTTEMGKTLAAAKAEVAKCATACRFYAEHAEDFLADEPADAAAVKATRAYVRYQPIGPVLAVMPWNFPLWQVMRFAAPALMAGNVGLLKHASNVPQTALFMDELFHRAGFPEGSFQTLLIGSDQVEPVLTDHRVRAATLTGSEGAGRAVAAIAGRELKKTVLELGGSDPFVVMPSADAGPGRQGGDHRAGPEQRPVLHRGEAVHRARGRVRRVRRAVRREHVGAAGRRPDGRRHRRRPARHRAGPRGRRRAGTATRRRRARRCCAAARRRTGPAGGTRRPWSPT